LNQTQKENDRLKQRVALLSAEKKVDSRLSPSSSHAHAPPLTTHTHTTHKRNQTDSGAEIATLQAQHQERLQKIVEAHNQDLTLLQETYQACAARLKETDAALAEEKRRVADLERARQDLAAAQLAAKPAPPPSTVPATQSEEHRGSEEEASTIRRLKEENDGLKQRVMALQQQHDLQQDAMAKVPSTPMLLFSLSQAYSCTSY
jgi:DNA repair exonuclease SbcCD ATPase subunit